MEPFQEAWIPLLNTSWSSQARGLDGREVKEVGCRGLSGGVTLSKSHPSLSLSIPVSKMGS